MSVSNADEQIPSKQPATLRLAKTQVMVGDMEGINFKEERCE
jgi:hypothetical protein